MLTSAGCFMWFGGICEILGVFSLQFVSFLGEGCRDDSPFLFFFVFYQK